MHRSIQKLLGSLLVLGCTAVLIWALGFLLRPVAADDSLAAIDAFHSIPKNSVEVIGYGSSHMQYGMDVMEMYEKYGIGAYNYGTHWQHINTTALFIEDSFETQSPKIAVVETFKAGMPLLNQDMNGEIYYTRRIKWVDGKPDYLKECLGENIWEYKERYLSYFVPLAGFHDNWQTVTGFSLPDPALRERFVQSMGVGRHDNVYPVTIGKTSDFAQQALSPRALDALNRIVALCRAHGTQLIFYTAPMQEEYAYADALTEFAAENGCVYLNLYDRMDETGLDPETDFSDTEHLNSSGARKVADYLGAYIKANYEVTDMRTVPGNQWAAKLP